MYSFDYFFTFSFTRFVSFFLVSFLFYFITLYFNGMCLIQSIEYANSAWDPFDINLDGWGESINEDLDSYEDLFGELHRKYKGGK